MKSKVRKISLTLLVLLCVFNADVCQNCKANGSDISARRKKFEEKIRKERIILLKSLRKLETSNYKIDLRKSLMNKDFRFKAYKELTLIVPGIANGRFNSYVQRRGISVIPGTSDVIESADERRLQRVIKNYLVPYNKALLAYLYKKDI